MQLRRAEDNVLICDNCVETTTLNWTWTQPILKTLVGTTVLQEIGAMEAWGEITLEFATDDPINTFARYDTLCYDAKRLKKFRLYDVDGTFRNVYVVGPPRVTRIFDPVVHIKQATCTIFAEGYIQ